MDFQVHCCGNFTPLLMGDQWEYLKLLLSLWVKNRAMKIKCVQHVHVFRLQSLDYDVCYNKPFSKMLASRDKKVRMSDKIKLATDSFCWV